MELRFAPLFSGSSGNSIYVGCDSGHLLVDAGVSCARVVAELRRLGVDPARLAGILVTHEHIDHIRGVGVLSRRYDLPVYATEGTWTAMEDKLGGVALKNARVLEPLRDLYVGGMNVMAFDIPTTRRSRWATPSAPAARAFPWPRTSAACARAG